MAKSRKKARKAAKRPAKKRTAKRKAAAKAKPRKAKARKAKPRKETSIVDVMTGAVSEAGELRARLAGHNTFED